MVPDLGLSREGLVLDMGPYAYRVQVQPDLSLRVFTPAGKINWCTAAVCN